MKKRDIGFAVSLVVLTAALYCSQKYMRIPNDSAYPAPSPSEDPAPSPSPNANCDVIHCPDGYHCKQLKSGTGVCVPDDPFPILR